ncbi:MAG: hypothetical protein V8R40_08675 [Dysosmobacter sp.]
MVLPPFAGVSGAKDKIGIGTYELNTDMDYRALISAIYNASGSMKDADRPVNQRSPRSHTVEQTIALLAKKRRQHRGGADGSSQDGHLRLQLYRQLLRGHQPAGGKPVPGYLRLLYQ